MAERLATSSAFGLVHKLGHHGAVRPAGLSVSELGDISLASVLARAGSGPALADRVRQDFGIELPMTPRRQASGAMAFVWAGPGHWLAVVEGDSAGQRLEARLRTSLAGLASVTDQSDGRALLRLTGPRARNTLAKGLPVDVDAAVMQPGDALVSAIAHVGVHLWQLDATPTYDIVVARSYAVSFWHWLQAAAAEFGLSVAPG